MATSTVNRTETASKPTRAAKASLAKTGMPKTRTTRPATKAKMPAAVKTVRSATLKQVATQSRRKASTVVHLTRDASFKLIDTQRSIWLAGLGALTKVTTSTGTKGEKAFEALIHAGEKLETQARDAIDANADLLKHRIDDATKVVDHGIDTVGDAFDARVKATLARLGYPKPGKVST